MAISMMEAYGIELLKANGISFEQLSEQFKQNQGAFNIDENFDFTVLKSLYDTDFDTFKQAYTDIYTVKFMTINGLRNIMRMRFNIPIEQYETLETGNGLRNVPASESIEQQIRTIVSSNWNVERNGKTLTLFV
ncbi:hypothetical protein [Solibacillus daqui]|uniref:hypothetical protein n=1 Tax=Solibacillus daqui TaxID=2912187 RepID=UPI0023665841|nr:hypothetical protein [Solibacillus daqui]